MPIKSSVKASRVKQEKVSISSFDASYAALNASQKKAVDFIEGPVMVIAGPGTGKTQVLSLRAANILKRTQMRPSNILCLTFSVSGATAMRERLRSIIGSDAYGITITTIHGFCHDLIQSHPAVFHDFLSLEHISDVGRYQLLNKILDQLPVGSELIYPKDRYMRTADILQRISEVKREGISMDRLEDVSRLYKNEMATKSREGTKAHERNLRMAKQFQEFIEIFYQYQTALTESQRYDFDDMILYAIRALEEEEWLRASLQERYQYILVDEYQDTNGAQNRVIELLSTPPEGVLQAPNIFVVGDDDQAIYRFQGANIANMMQFHARFPDSPVITLTQSYRSSQEILDASMHLIEHNEERLVRTIPGIEKKMVSSAIIEHGPMPELLRPVSDLTEPFVLAERIQEFLKAGISPEEIAVLVRTNRELETLHTVLKGFNIPVQRAGKLDVLAHSSVRSCITLLQAIMRRDDDHLYSSALALPCFGCSMADLGTLLALQRERNDTFKKEGKAYRPLIDVCAELEVKQEEWGITNAQALLRTRDIILSLSLNRETLTLPDLLESTLHQSGLIPEDPLTIDPLDLAALQAFFSFVKNRCHENLSFDLPSLMADLSYRERYGIALTYDVPHLLDTAVQLMTAHGAKGLEFTVVFLMNFREKHWGKRRKLTGLSLPEHLLFASHDDENDEDERRLAYVAWTRAKKYLIFSCPERVTMNEREQSVAPSVFFAEAGSLPERAATLTSSDRVSTLLLPTFDVHGDEHLRTFLRRRLETYRLSVSSLNKFLADPLLFLREDLLMLPQARDPITAYGIAVHSALLEWGKHVAEGFSREDLLRVFHEAINEKEVLTSVQKMDLLDLGTKALTRYYDERLSQERPIISALEKSLTTHYEDIPLTGKLDRIDLYHETGSHVHIIDYKTGSPKTEKQVKEDRNGDLYRQLVFYKLLTDLSPQFAGYTAEELSLEFIGERSEEPRRLTFSIPVQDIHDLQELIKKVWQKIQALDFTSL